MLLCLYEDRQASEPALRLLVDSLDAHSPGQQAVLFHRPTPHFAEWLRSYPAIQVREPFVGDGIGWNVKPEALLRLLHEGHEEVVWLDSDILIARDIRPLFAGLDPAVLATTEEALWGGHDDGEARRARAWGFPVGRTLPFCLNTAVTRVTAMHIPLIERWVDLLSDPAYRAAQAIPVMERPEHLIGDQDVLTALLCSRAFAAVPLLLLRRGTHILQAFGLKGFTLAERLRVLVRGLPPFIHTQQSKPWLAQPGWHEPGLRGAIGRAYADTSPYILQARRHRRAIAPQDQWLEPRTGAGKALRFLGAGRPVLAGLPLAALVDAATILGKAMRRARKRRHPETPPKRDGAGT